MNTYKPEPIITDEIILPDEICLIAEKLAKNSHEVWAEGRINDGWTYGRERNDVLKTTPCLVPYEELSDSEKEYDRRMSKETLKVLIALGYRIEYIREVPSARPQNKIN